MKYTLLFLCCLLLTVPVMGQNVAYTAPSGQAVWAIYINSPVGTHGTIEIYQANGDTTTGYWSYTGGLPTSTFTASLGSSGTQSFGYTIPVNMVSVNMEIWNGDNSSTDNSRKLKFGFGQLALGQTGLWNGVGSTDINRAVITGYSITADNVVSVHPELIDIRQAATNLASTEGQGLPELLKAYVPLVAAVFFSLIYWLKYLFVDHLILVISLYLTGSMAYAINTSRNIFIFYKTWFKQQIAMFNFIAGAFSTTFQIVTQVAIVVGQAVGSLINVAVIAARLLLRV
jgi:hypothetical protein